MGLKLSVFTVATPEFTPEELALAAKQAGIHAIEWRFKEPSPGLEAEAPSFWGNNRSTLDPNGGSAHLARFKQAAEAQGLRSISVTPYLQAGDLEKTEQVLAAAKAMGASYIRLGVPGYDRSQPFGVLFALGRRYLKECEALCRSYGVKGLMETHHGTIAASASGAFRLCEGLDPDAVGVLYDPGNMVHEGFENYRMGLELLGPYLAHVHVKNAAWYASEGSADWHCDWSSLRLGMVPWAQVIADLAAVGYDGYLGIEDFSRAFGASDMLRHFADYMRELTDSSAGC